MFWAKRLKTQGDDSSWAVPFGDLMSLLLAVFVLIASMSELRSGQRSEHIGRSIKAAFGAPSRVAERRVRPEATLRERLEQGLSHATTVRFSDATEERLPSCEVIGDADRIVIRVAGADSFLGPTGVAGSQTRKLLAVIADHVRDGQACLEVWGYGPEGALLPALPYQDALDVAAERARTICRELNRAGVKESRLVPLACAEPAGGRGFEIVVRASPAATAGRAVSNATEGGRKDG